MLFLVYALLSFVLGLFLVALGIPLDVGALLVIGLWVCLIVGYFFEDESSRKGGGGF